MKKTNKLISILLVLAMLLSMAPLNLTAFAASPTPYDGVPVTPKQISSSNYVKLGLTDDNWSQFDGYYAIRNAKELYGFASIVNNAYSTHGINGVLLQDIVVNVNGDSTYDWMPLNDTTNFNYYEGIFDGNGYSISGLYSTKVVKRSGTNIRDGGFICTLRGTVKNLVIKDSTFAPEIDIRLTGGLGAICGTTDECTIENCRVENVTLKSKSVNGKLGGIAGYYISGDIESCVSINVTFSGGNITDPIAPNAPYTSCYTSATDSHTCSAISVEHNEVKATCEYPGLSNYKYCLVCNNVTSGIKTETSATGHTWNSATCNAPQTCSSCDLTEGSTVPHKYTTYTLSTNAMCGANAKETALCYYGCSTTDTREISGTALAHSYTYSASGNTITAVCANGVNCPESEGTLTISAPADLYADGTTAKEAVIDDQLVEAAAYTVTYSTADGTAPTTAGTYTASVTVGGATASVEFELVKRSAIAENFVYTAPENIVYDGTAKYATVEASPEITGLGEITVTYYKDGEAVEPIDAGTYTVKVSTADSDKYYAINDVELASFTIAAKDISDGFIILGDALTYNGTEQTQTVEKVVATGTAPEVTYTVSGNKATNVGVYLLTVTGTGNFTGEAKIAYEIAVDMNGVDFDQLHWGNVKSTDKERIEYIYNQVDNAVTDLASDEKKAEWNNLRSTCVELLKMIESVTDHLDSFKEEVAGYDIDTVTSDDYDYLERLSESEGQWLYDHSENYTEEEIKDFSDVLDDVQKLKIRISDVANEITRITNAVNSYDEATVKYSDYKDILQLIDDIEALTDGQNITADERASLEELNTKANLLAAKIRSTADEISRITRAVNAYNINTVKSSDKADIENLIARISKLTDGDNITDAEREQLVANDETLDALLAKINATADEIERIEESVNSYDEATVKSSDKADIEQLKADIKELTDGQNLTADEREYLINADAECDKLLAKIAETKSEYDRVIAAANGYDEATVTSEDRADVDELRMDAHYLAVTDNVTDEEKENLLNVFEKLTEIVETLINVGNEIERIISAVGGYDEATVKYSDYKDILQLIDDIEALTDGQNITDDERASLEELNTKANLLAAKIRSTADEIARITRAVNAYSIDTVKSSDKTDIENLIARIKKLTDGDNITADERAKLNELDSILDSLLAKIAETADELARLEAEVGKYDEATVKSTDKADLEKLVEDIKALTDATNITEEERTALEALDEKADALIKKIDDTAAEIERIDEAVNAYDEETVTSSDIPALGKLIDDIKALTDGDNLTNEEKAALEEADKAIDELVEKLAEVAEAIKRVDEAVKSYDENTVKSTDKEDLAQLKDDVQALIDSSNTTDNEKTVLGEMIDTIKALEDKIAETEEKLEEIAEIENGYNPETVSSDDKTAIEETIAEIKAVNPDNLTDEQKAEYEEIKAELEALLEEIAAAEKDVADIGVELEMFDEERVTKFWEDDIEALKAKIDELLADENMGEAEKAKLNEYKAQAEKLIEIINTPKEYFSLRFFYLIWDCLTWKYNGILWLFSIIFGC